MDLDLSQFLRFFDPLPHPTIRTLFGFTGQDPGKSHGKQVFVVNGEHFTSTSEGEILGAPLGKSYSRELGRSGVRCDAAKVTERRILFKLRPARATPTHGIRHHP